MKYVSKASMLYILLFAIAIGFSGCHDDDTHVLVEDLPADQSVVLVGLNTSNVSVQSLNNVSLFWFDATDRLCRTDYYPSMTDLANGVHTMSKGSYTVMALLNQNLASSTVPTSTDLVSYSDWLKQLTSSISGMMTGSLAFEVSKPMHLIYIDLHNDDQGIINAQTQLHLNIPDQNLPDYVSTRSGEPSLRATAFIFQKGSTTLYATKRVMLTQTTATGAYAMDLSLFKGDYDISLWVDYAPDELTDHHYQTTLSNDVMRIRSQANYAGNSDHRDAFSQRTSISLNHGVNTATVVDMTRPLAKYKVVATDVEAYETLRAKQGLPALADLTPIISYDSYLPTAYSIVEDRPADADTGYQFSSSFDNQTATQVDVAKDYIFVDGNGSSVTISILFKDATGKIVSGLQGIKVNYRAGQLTTVKGNFLTAGLGGGIEIDTEWGEDINVEF